MAGILWNNVRDRDKIGAAAHQNDAFPRHVGGEPIGAVVARHTISRDGFISNGTDHWRDSGDELGLP